MDVGIFSWTGTDASNRDFQLRLEIPAAGLCFMVLHVDHFEQG
jgi:hypothetical protein